MNEHHVGNDPVVDSIYLTDKEQGVGRYLDQNEVGISRRDV